MGRATKVYSVTLAANATYELLVDAGYYKILAATGALNIRRDGGTLLSNLQPGQGERVNFTRLQLQDTSGAQNTVQLVVADDSFVDDRIFGTVTLSPLGATFANANKTVTNASGQLLAANAARKYLLVQNNGTGDIYVTLDGTAATTANGVRLAAGGGTMELSTVVPSGAINAIGAIANNPNVVVVEG